MEYIGKRKRFSLYADGKIIKIPEDPAAGDPIHYHSDANIKIIDSVSGKELTWLVFREDQREIWLCDRVLVDVCRRTLVTLVVS